MTEKSASDTTGVEPVDSDVVEPVDSDVFATAAFAKMAEDWAGFSGIFGLLVLVYVVGLVADAHWAGATQCALTAVATWRLVAVCHVVRRARIVLLSMAGAAVVVSLLGLAGTRDFSAALSSSLLVVLFFFL
ncbi:MAG: hypothetical protein IT198_04510, partial [Acidimicrobiia bacterium]|nr:hypothetical protein [Acidimicrobiia bacterium]